MSDDRPVEDVPSAVARLTKELADLKATALARAGRKPTGDIEPTIRATPKTDTLLLQGQTVSRATYPVLWQWVQDQGLVPSVFGAGDGSTTFVLPDLRGKAVVGATTVDPLGTSFGSASQTLTEAHIPAHNHGEFTGGNGDHEHNIHGVGDHGLHVVGTSTATDGSGFSRTIPGDSTSEGSHSHGMDQNGHHVHGIPTYGQDPPDPIFVVQPSYAVNWLIWV